MNLKIKGIRLDLFIKFIQTNINLSIIFRDYTKNEDFI